MSTVTLPRLQHIIGSGLVAAVGASVCYISYTQQPSEAFLFPRLISSVFLVLALWPFIKACLGWTKVGNGISMTQFKNLAPGLVVALIYMGVMYGLFALLLKVYTPREIFF